MFLTRLGFESKAVITGDVTQIDLPDNRKSGLREAELLLRGIEGISFCTFTDVDVVRHPLVQQIIRAYDAAALAAAAARSGPPRANVPVAATVPASPQSVNEAVPGTGSPVSAADAGPTGSR